MATKKPPFKTLKALLRRHIATGEEETTKALIRELRGTRQRGFLEKRELEKICRWKSARAIHHIRSNSEASIRRATRVAFRSRSERVRLDALVALRGVSVPMASAILMLVDPRRYGVIDIRVWQLLHVVGSVSDNERGVRFTFNNWYRYLKIIRYFAAVHSVSARDIERTLFIAHKKYQIGRLYDN